MLKNLKPPYIVIYDSEGKPCYMDYPAVTPDKMDENNPLKIIT